MQELCSSLQTDIVDNSSKMSTVSIKGEEMIQNLEVDWPTWVTTERKKYNVNWISSVSLSMDGVDVYSIRKLCKNHPKFHALCINISGTIKYWYAREHINQMIDESTREL